MHDKTSIIYTLPSGVSSQKLNGKRIEDVFKKVSVFLENCTNIKADQPSGIEIIAYSPFSEKDDPQISSKYISEVNALFGAGRTEPLAFSYPSGQSIKAFKVRWRINIEELNKTLEYLIKGQPWPIYTFGPIELILSYNFKLIEPSTKKILPDQETSHNHLLLWFSRTKSCSATFSFPFEEPSTNFFDYVEKVLPYIPFKFDYKYLRIAKPIKAGTGYTYKKIS